MAFLGFLHNYTANSLIDSSDWNDELNQLVALLGSGVIANPNAAIMLVGQQDGSNEPILQLDNLTAGRLIELTNGTLLSTIESNGQLKLGASGIVGLSVASTVKCPNLNADLLNSKTSGELETKLYSQHSFQIFLDDVHLIAGSESPVFVATVAGLIITKLKIKQEGVASADAITTIDVRKNGISLGTVTINGNITAVQSNDIGDVVLVLNDIISFHINTYSGTTKHVDVTAAIHYKNKYN